MVENNPIQQGTTDATQESVLSTPTTVDNSSTDSRYQWYAIVTQPALEKQAKANLEERIRKLNLQDYFKQIVIPVQEVDYVDAKGKKKKKEQKIMPGYMLLQMDMSDATFACVRDTPKIGSFVGATNIKLPPPLTALEVDRVLNRAKYAKQEQAAKPKVSFEKGERVMIIDGPFTNFIGDVDEVKLDKQKLRVLVPVFGRPTPVEIEFSKVQKVVEGQEPVKI